MKKLSGLLLTFFLSFATAAHADLYTTNFGTQLSGPSNCDDCFAGPIAFSGSNQSINFFNNSYSSLYVGSNGYVTFGAGRSDFGAAPLNTQTVGPMIAGFFTDLDSRNDARSNIYVNTSNIGEIIATWVEMGHYSRNYSQRSTFQLLIRSDQASVPVGEGRIGFFYGSMTDTNIGSAGFGDGLIGSNPGEEAFASQVSGTTLSNNNPRYYGINNGVPTSTQENIPEPDSWMLLAVGLVGFIAARKKKTT